ncbi:RNA-binding domain-containing protein [Curtobacterium sp. 24E2]|nr:hypothetical protein JN350_02660 [Curtobacterium sp. 24E2]
MALNIDTSRPLRSPRQLLSLVEAVFAADPSDEKPYLEWKSALLLGKQDKASHASIGRCIIGMANRTVASASSHFGGCGYMVIGVEPGTVSGIEMPDPAMFEDWVNRYAGADGPVWTVDTVRFQDCTVLVVIIDPPAAGDRIHSMRTTYDSWDRGTIFVRKLARTEKAEPGDIRQLEERLLAGTATGPARLDDVAVRMSQSGCVRVLDGSAARRDAAVEAASAGLVQLPEANQSATSRLVVANYDTYTERERSRYERRSREYLAAYQRHAVQGAVRAAVAALEGRIWLQIDNDTEVALEGVQVRVQLPDGVSAFEDRTDIDDVLPSVPEPPRNSIAALIAPSLLSASRWDPPAMPSLQRQIVISPSRQEVTLKFDVVHPRDTERSDTFVLIASSTALDALDVAAQHWRADAKITARNRSGFIAASVMLEPIGPPIGVDQVLTEAS